VSTAVGLLGDLPTLVPVLEKLGLQHVGYAVQPEHYNVVGQALLQTLGGALGDKFTDPVKNAWTKVYGVMSKTMIGDNYKKVEEAKKEAATGDDDKKKKEAAAKKKASDDKKKKEAAAKKKAADDKKAKEDAEKKKKEEAEKKKKDDEEALKAIKAGLKAKEAAWKKLDKKEADEKAKKLHNAAKAGDLKGVKEMLEGDIWIEAADKDGWTAMIFAGHAGKLDMIKMLIDLGGDPLAKVALGEWGNTAIHYAAREGHRDVVKFLMKHKVGKKALTIKNHNGKTPAQMAKDSVADLFD
jgi:ankyrin repeat protein